ncbi:MAG: MBL fold metallo-hydrolase [Gemmatimonadaceae bacterium]|nr:MBL fold metallo-hydrolase [Gemmatimonadaceae bacterium]
MNRRAFLWSSSSATAALTAAPLTPFLRRFAQAQPPAVTFAELRRGVGMITGSGGTIGYLINRDGAVAIDSQYANTAPVCIAGLKERSPKGVSLLVNTHHHGDHTGGNAAFRPMVSKIVQQVNCATWHKRVAEQSNSVAAQAFADVTFTDVWTSDFGDERLEARYYGPGHTGGDCVVTMQRANVMHLGDLYFNRAHPNIDRAAGAQIANWIVALEKITASANADTLFIAGHAKAGAASTSRADVLHFRDYLSAVLSHAQRGVQAGQSRADVQALPSLAGFDDFALLNARLSLAFVLGIAFDEVSERR